MWTCKKQRATKITCTIFKYSLAFVFPAAKNSGSVKDGTQYIISPDYFSGGSTFQRLFSFKQKLQKTLAQMRFVYIHLQVTVFTLTKIPSICGRLFCSVDSSISLPFSISSCYLFKRKLLVLADFSNLFPFHHCRCFLSSIWCYTAHVQFFQNSNLRTIFLQATYLFIPISLFGRICVVVFF